MSTITEEAPFTFPCIDYGFDERQYLRAVDMIRDAATLFGDGSGGELGNNKEYERGQAELICMYCNIPLDLKDQVINEIHDVARLHLEENNNKS